MQNPPFKLNLPLLLVQSSSGVPFGAPSLLKPRLGETDLPKRDGLSLGLDPLA
ncbi:hypothetical protein DEO72_LG5g1861 [Vigna unguiculata]|uniref:Uncharacterized protein n=1 Tax=Vigna unguiculata TaxID=3917 RepID=A0A4D6LYF8_VIGUN|nr:hypothetical protein DEO72_LG5g1861 [Vigna unguiculata]